MNIKIYKETDNPMPAYKNDGDAGMDIRSNEDIRVRAFNWAIVSTGLFVVIPYGYEVWFTSIKFTRHY
jgi:dUTPase